MWKWRCSSSLFSALSLGGGKSLSSLPGRFTTGIWCLSVLHTEEEAGWTVDSNWTFGEDCFLPLSEIEVGLLVVLRVVRLLDQQKPSLQFFLLSLAASLYLVWILSLVACSERARYGTVGWRTAPQAGFQLGSLECFIDLIFPAALWPWVRLSL